MDRNNNYGLGSTVLFLLVEDRRRPMAHRTSEVCQGRCLRMRSSLLLPSSSNNSNNGSSHTPNRLQLVLLGTKAAEALRLGETHPSLLVRHHLSMVQSTELQHRRMGNILGVLLSNDKPLRQVTHNLGYRVLCNSSSHSNNNHNIINPSNSSSSSRSLYLFPYPPLHCPSTVSLR